MRPFKFRPFLFSLAGLALIASACGTSGGGSPSSTARGTITVAGFNFNESSILAYIYGKALADKGYTVNYKLNLGSREVVEPALEAGNIDLYPGYAATELEYLNKGKGEATGDPTATVAKLNTYLAPKKLLALDPSPAADGNAFAVTQKTATQYSLKTLSDLASIGNKLTLGGPPECPTRPFCQAGLVKTYGIIFKAFKPLDAGGPLTKTALSNGDIDVGLVFSSDGGIVAKGFVVLKDDKQLEAADNVIPVIRSAVANQEVKDLLNKVDAALNLADLTAMNKSADIDKQDPDTLAQKWLKDHGFIK